MRRLTPVGARTFADKFYTKLRARMDKLRIGSPLDKSIDVGAIVDPVQLQASRINGCRKHSWHTFAAADMPAERDVFIRPTLITGLHPADTLMQEEMFGPVLVSTTFRTPREAVNGQQFTLWLGRDGLVENINLALDIAPKLAAGIVWINGTNMMDAAAGFGGVRESGLAAKAGGKVWRLHQIRKQSR